jgi:hypothetical protein
MRGSSLAGFGHGEGEHSWGHGWDHGHDRDHDHDGGHDHDGDHDGHHHHHDHDGGFFFLDDPYFDYYGDAGVDYVAVPGNDGYWYYCPDSNSYYPYVSVCASQWERVTPYQ